MFRSPARGLDELNVHSCLLCRAYIIACLFMLCCRRAIHQFAPYSTSFASR